MKLSRLIQMILLVLIWVLIILALLVLSLISVASTAWSMPAWLILILVVAGVLLTGMVASSDRFAELDRQFEDKIGDLSDIEMLKLMEGLDDVRDSLGISIELPVKGKKRKREDIDKAIRNLSDTELLHLKDQLRDGSIEEEKLIGWLNSPREMTE